ncbi:MAG: Uroporphyrinogen decarboxylase [Phycisphaerae bacterium]|nr:Uroporphyrinogen decarboxylase [Phycisphaerae bacterium]
MSPREIFLRALVRLPTPRPAVGSATSIVTCDLMDRAGVWFPDAHRDARQMADLAAAGAEVLGFDNVMPLFSVLHESAALGCDVDWGRRDNMPQCRRPPWRLGDAVTVPDGLLDHPACRVALEAIALMRRRFDGRVAVVGKVFGPWTLGYHLFGVEPFLIGTLDAPDAVRRAMDAIKEVTVRFARAQIDAGADALTLGDHATRDLCSPQAYRDFLMPIHAELAERIGCPLILHICGDTSDRIEMIRRTGVACFHYDSKVDDAAARRLAGGRMSLMGGMSNLRVIRGGDEAAVRADVAAKRAAGIDIIGPECAVPLDAPYRNMRLLAEAVKGEA